MSQAIELFLKSPIAPVQANDSESTWKKELANATTSAHSLLKRLDLEAHLGITD